MKRRIGLPSLPPMKDGIYTAFLYKANAPTGDYALYLDDDHDPVVVNLESPEEYYVLEGDKLVKEPESDFWWDDEDNDPQVFFINYFEDVWGDILDYKHWEREVLQMCLYKKRLQEVAEVSRTIYWLRIYGLNGEYIYAITDRGIYTNDRVLLGEYLEHWDEITQFEL